MSKPSKALLILESPWFDIEENSGQASVYPFLHGLEKLEDNFRVYHATFYDEASFEAALEHLASADYPRAFLYVAAHGNRDGVGNIPIENLLACINAMGTAIQLEGVILGACYAGVNVIKMKEWMRQSSIVWMMGYRYSVDWLSAMLIDLAVFQLMVAFPKQWLHKRATIFNRITDAILLFNGNAEIASDESERSYPLRDSITLVIQPAGRGQRPQDMSPELSEIWGEGSIPLPKEHNFGIGDLLKMLWKKFF